MPCNAPQSHVRHLVGPFWPRTKHCQNGRVTFGRVLRVGSTCAAQNQAYILRTQTPRQGHTIVFPVTRISPQPESVYQFARRFASKTCFNNSIHLFAVTQAEPNHVRPELTYFLHHCVRHRSTGLRLVHIQILCAREER